MEIIEQSARSGIATSALVCGILAFSLNLLFFTAIIGVVIGFIAIILGIISYKNHRYGKAGLILGLLSLVVVFAYLFSYVAIKVVDPFV